MNTSFVHKIIAGLCVLYIVAIAVMWRFGTQYAQKETEALIREAQKNLIVTLNDYLDHLLVANALKIIDQCGTYEKAAQADLAAYSKMYGFDEINIVDPNGIEIASTVSSIIGKDMHRTAHTADFLRLLDGKTMVHTQPLRPSVDEPDKRFKYCGVAFTGGKGFIQVGYSEERFKKGFPIIFRTLTQSWRIGNKGYYIFADANTDIVVSEPKNRVGLSLASIGIDPAAIPVDENVSFKRTVFDQDCICRATLFAGHRLIAIVPQDEYQRNLAIFVILFAVILFLFLAFLGSMLVGSAKSNDHLKTFIKEKQEQMHKEMQVAKTIQASALPCVFPPYPNLLEFDIFAQMKTAKHVGGDFYDFFFLDNDHIAFLIADVSGKGIPAAMFMMTAKTTIRSIASSCSDPADILKMANARLAENNDADMFVTVWLGILDPKTGLLAYANAGHNFPVVKRAEDKSVEWIRSKPSLVLAAMPNAKYKSFEITLKPGDILFLYTDGITEAVNPALELYGEKRLEDAVAHSSSHVCTDVEADVVKFADGAEQADDMTMLALKYRGAPVTTEKAFPVAIDAMHDISAFLGKIFAEQNCPQKFCSELQVANDEIVSNIIKFSGAKELTLRVEHVPVVNIWRLSYIDSGVQWNPLTVVEPDTTLSTAERPVGGLGVLMYKNLVDNVRYVRENDQNIIQLRKKLRA